MYKKPITVDDELKAKKCLLGTIYIVDDDPDICSSLSMLIDVWGFNFENYGSAAQFLNDFDDTRQQFPGPAVLLSDVQMHGLNGIQLLEIIASKYHIPVILMSGDSSMPEVIQAFKMGVHDFLLKPIEADDLKKSIEAGLKTSTVLTKQAARNKYLMEKISRLTPRELDVVRKISQGKMNKMIAAELSISERMVKFHKQSIMLKLEADSQAQLIRLLDSAGDF